MFNILTYILKAKRASLPTFATSSDDDTHTRSSIRSQDSHPPASIPQIIITRPSISISRDPDELFESSRNIESVSDDREYLLKNQGEDNQNDEGVDAPSDDLADDESSDYLAELRAQDPGDHPADYLAQYSGESPWDEDNSAEYSAESSGGDSAEYSADHSAENVEHYLEPAGRRRETIWDEEDPDEKPREEEEGGAEGSSEIKPADRRDNDPWQGPGDWPENNLESPGQVPYENNPYIRPAEEGPETDLEDDSTDYSEDPFANDPYIRYLERRESVRPYSSFTPPF